MVNYQFLLGLHPFWTPCCNTAELSLPAVRTEVDLHKHVQILWLLVWKLQLKTRVLSSRKHKTMCIHLGLHKTHLTLSDFILPDTVFHMEHAQFFRKNFWTTCLFVCLFVCYQFTHYRYIGENTLGILIIIIAYIKLCKNRYCHSAYNWI